MTALAALAPIAGGCQFRWGWPLLVVASAALWLLALCVPTTSRPPLAWVFLALIGLHVLQLIPLPPSLWTALSPIKARFLEGHNPPQWEPLSAHLEATRDNLLVLLSGFAAYSLGWRVLRHRRDVLRFGLVMLATTAALSVYGFALLGDNSPTKFLGVPQYPYGNRVCSTYTGANQFAGYLTLALPVCAAAIIIWAQQEGRHTHRHVVGWILDALQSSRHALILLALAAAWLVGAAALLATQSRMGIASFVFAGLVTVLLLARRALRASHLVTAGLALAILLLAGLLLGLDPVLERYSLLFESRWAQEEGVEAVESRPAIWRDTLPLIRDHWLTGGGSGSFRTLYTCYQSPRIGGWAKFAHNDYLNAAADLGIVGLAVILGGLSAWFVLLVRASRQDHPLRRPVFLAAFWAVTALLLHEFTLFNLQEPANAWLFCLLLGMGMGFCEERAPDSPFSQEPGGLRAAGRLRLLARVAAGLVMVVGGVAVFWSEAVWPEDRAAAWAERAARNVDALRGEAQTARCLDPWNSRAYVHEAHALIGAAWALRDTEKEKAGAYLGQAEVLLERTLSISALDKDAWFERVRLAVAQGKLPEAHAMLLKTFQAAPHWPAWALARARIELQMWNVEGQPGAKVPDSVLESLESATSGGSLACLQQALDLLVSASGFEPSWERVVPHACRSLRLYADTLKRLGNLTEALRVLHEALGRLDQPDERLNGLERDALREQIVVEIGTLHVALGQYSRATERFRAALGGMLPGRRAEEAVAIWERARQEGFPREGASLAEALRGAFPEEAWGPEIVARSCYWLELWDEAEVACRQALAMAATAERYELLASIFYGKGQLDSALTSLQRAVMLRPDNAGLRMQMADWLSLKGYTSRALDEVEAVRLAFPEMEERCVRFKKTIQERRTRVLMP